MAAPASLPVEPQPLMAEATEAKSGQEAAPKKRGGPKKSSAKEG